jgi:hypothetical protein
VLQGDSLDEER